MEADIPNSAGSNRIQGSKSLQLNVKSTMGGHNAQSQPEIPNLDQNRKVFEMALEYIRQSAESGCPEAHTELGHIYELGGIKDPKSNRIHKLTKKSIQKAKEHY